MAIMRPSQLTPLMQPVSKTKRAFIQILKSDNRSSGTWSLLVVDSVQWTLSYTCKNGLSSPPSSSLLHVVCMFGTAAHLLLSRGKVGDISVYMVQQEIFS